MFEESTRYNPRTVARAMMDMVKVLVPGKVADIKTLEAKILSWEDNIRKLERDHQESFKDPMKMAILTFSCPPSIQDVIYQKVDTIKTCHEMEESILTLVRNRVAMGIGGAVGLASAANAFVGMVEAPLLIRPYLEKLTRSELFMTMTVGLATVSGTVLVLYASVIEPVVPGALGQILVASLVSLPAAILVARLMVPEEPFATPTGIGDDVPFLEYQSSMDAVTRGTFEGLQLLLNIIAMLVVMVALVALVNILLALLPDLWGAPLTLQRMLGWLFSPLVWAMGVPPGEMHVAGQLMGTKTILNELIAYLDLAGLPEGALSERSTLIMVYALCGFANFGSVGILIGGLTALVPSRRADIVTLGTRAIVSGTLATSMTGAVVGLIT